MPLIKDQSKRDRNAHMLFGCSESEAISLNGGLPLRHRDSLAMAYTTQRYAANRRGIAWHLTFEQWLWVWKDSGLLGRRGRGKGRYCMARHGDIGPYSIGNVSISSCVENSRDGVATRHSSAH